MLKLKKIYLENFKGIAGKQIVDFKSADLSILNGPNGFGKTTTFDAIELCLRGKLERTVKFGNIQKNNQNYKKPFYQNTIGNDVVVKVQFQDTITSSIHIIIKFLDRNSSGQIGNSKKFRPDAWGLLETFYSNDEGSFDKEIDKRAIQTISQQEIDRLFFNDVNLSHQNLYPLFNYLQQEENIYFLKKDEEEKKEELKFLFQTQQQAAELDKLNFLLKGIKSIKDGIEEKINQLGRTAKTGEVQAYLRFFEDKVIGYDQEEPFLDLSPTNLTIVYDAYLKEIEILEEFLSKFRIEEYAKDKLREAITYASENQNILIAFIIQRLTSPDSFERFEVLASRRLKYANALKNIEFNRFERLTLEELGFSADFVANYTSAVQDSDIRKGAVGEIGKIINDLNVARHATMEKASSLNTPVHEPENCPLCDASWKGKDSLDEAVMAKTNALIDFNRGQLAQLEELNLVIKNNYQFSVQQRIEEFLLSPSNQLDAEFFSQLREHRGFSERIKRFQAIVSQSGVSFDNFIIDSPISGTQLFDVVEKLKADMAQSLLNIIPDQEKLINKHLFKDLFAEDQSALLSVLEIQNKRAYVEYKYNEARMFSLNTLNVRLDKFKGLEGQITKVRNALDQSIKKYKMEMIEKIKIPFYLYSGKILQNYQQGLGIFIDMQGNTNRVRFLTDNESDHDIIHHLSSGQLAVVSIAFCLALNKVYETTNHFKFLAIDDPVQTLDDINIHSFIELMRHDFSDYQIIMSTHEEDIANYLAYKFEKFDFKCNRLKVQKIFYSSLVN